jgi:hypothetical protein
MPDISMCRNRDCPMRVGCLRYLAIPNPDWQSFGDFKPKADGRCHFFVKSDGWVVREVEAVDLDGEEVPLG